MLVEGKTLDENILDKQIVLDYLWCHSHFYSTRLYECEELYRRNRGHIAILMLFSCFESISKSVVNDYDSSSFNIYQKLKEQQFLSETEYNFINTDEFSLRKIRNLFAHANIGAINLIVDENGKKILWPLTENETALLLYELISDTVFNLILKIVSSTFVEEVKAKFSINLGEHIASHKLAFRTLTSKELLVLKGFPEDYIPDDLDIPEDAKIRLIDNSPDVNVHKYVFGRLSSNADDEAEH